MVSSNFSANFAPLGDDLLHLLIFSIVYLEKFLPTSSLPSSASIKIGCLFEQFSDESSIACAFLLNGTVRPNLRISQLVIRNIYSFQ